MRGRAACRYGRISFFFSLVVGGVLFSCRSRSDIGPDASRVLRASASHSAAHVAQLLRSGV